MGRRGEEFIMILDIDRVFSADELALVTQTDGGLPEAERESVMGA